MRKAELARTIDHTLLGPTASVEEVTKLCKEAQRHAFASVCVNPCHAALARELMEGSQTKICVVIGFPHGMNTTEAKGFEAQRAVYDGADELDMVINIAALKEGDYETVIEDVKSVRAACDKAPKPVLLKVILETALLEGEEKVAGAILAKAAGANFVKTSTGFGPSGATVEDVALLRKTVGEGMGVKAAGGIRDYDTAVAMLEAGASRIGASRSVSILEGAPD